MNSSFVSRSSLLIFSLFAIPGFINVILAIPRYTTSFFERLLEIMALILILSIGKNKLSELLLFTTGLIYLTLNIVLHDTGLVLSPIILDLKLLAIPLILLLLVQKFNYLDSQYRSRNADQLFKLMTSLLFFTYLLNLFVNTERGEFWGENNFEMLGVTILFILAPKTKLNLGLFVIVALLSLSRSALAICATTIILCYGRTPFRTLIAVIVGTMVLLVSTYLLILTQRLDMENLQAIDRVVFALVMIRDMGAEPMNWLFGKGFGVPLTDATCHRLRFYSFAFRDYNCFSVIFHAGVLRAIVAGGLLYLSVILFILWQSLKPLNDSQVVIIIAIVMNGLSVSGFGNSFLLFPFILILTVAYAQNKFRSQN